METSLRLAALREDIASRLRHVCVGWPEERVAAVVDHIATLTLKYEGRGGTTMYDVRSTDLLVKKLEEGLRQSEELRNRPPGLAQGIGSIPHIANRGRVPPRNIPTRKPESGAP
jgi:hypothetical protein